MMEFYNFWRMYLCAWLLVLLGIYQGAIADCTCFPKHPQQHFCESDFVIKATVRALDIALPNGSNVTDAGLMDLAPEVVNGADKVWKLRITRVFKGKAFLFTGISVQAYTPLFDGRCGVNHIQENRAYVITGNLQVDGKLTFDFCNWHRKWTEVTARQKKGFRNTYRDNCSCHVHTCGIGSTCGEREKQFLKVCDWDPFRGACYNKHATCVMKGGKGCEWSYPAEHPGCAFPSG